MGLFRKKKKNGGDKAAAAVPPPPPPQPQPQPGPTARSCPSRSTLSIHGLPVTVWGLDQLTPSSSPAAPLPEICLAIHMHGRGGSAENEEWICRGLWTSAVEERKADLGVAAAAAAAAAAPPQAHRARELLVVGFDARNHGHRLTDELAQKGWGVGNEQHALDLYGMILGTAADVSHLISFLPAYLFPNDDRQITTYAVTGKSLGGHSVWHVLKDDRRVQIGVSLIGMPDYTRLLDFRTKQSFKPNAPPTVPGTLQKLIRDRDPPFSGYDRWDKRNPYWGKKILALSGAQDKLVHPSFSQPFLSRLAISHPEGRTGEQLGLKVRWFDGVKHQVTQDMVAEAGQWIGKWGLVV